MPAAAVIPAPIAYIYVAVFKKLVVGSRQLEGGTLCSVTTLLAVVLSEAPGCSSPSVLRCWQVYFEKIRVHKAGS